MRSRTRCTLVLSLALLAGCCCPPASSSSGGRTAGGDPSSGAFAFLGGLRCFFGSDNSSNEETRKVKDEDLAQKPKADETDHAAALTIR